MKTSIAVASLLTLFVINPVLAHEEGRSGDKFAHGTQDRADRNHHYNGRSAQRKEQHDEHAGRHKQYRHNHSVTTNKGRHVYQHRSHARWHAQHCRQQQYRRHGDRECSVRWSHPHHGQHQAFAQRRHGPHLHR